MRYFLETDAPDYMVESCASMAAAELGLFTDVRDSKIYVVSPSGKKLLRLKTRKDGIIIEDYLSQISSALLNLFFALVFIAGPILGKLGLGYQLIIYIIAAFMAIQLAYRLVEDKGDYVEKFGKRLLAHLVSYGYPTSLRKR